MYGEPRSAYRYAPDGLAGKALDELINRAYAEVANAPGRRRHCWTEVRRSSVSAGCSAERWLQ
jgi:hypothetical protein